MDANDFIRLENASRTAMAYVPDDMPHNVNRLLAAALPAFGILVASALMLAAVI